MTIMEMVGQSGVMTILGVGTVFSFLILMVLSVTLMGKIFRVLGLDKDVQAPTAKDAPATETASHGATVAAITAAVTEYRK